MCMIDCRNQYEFESKISSLSFFGTPALIGLYDVSRPHPPKPEYIKNAKTAADALSFPHLVLPSHPNGNTTRLPQSLLRSSQERTLLPT